MRYLCIEIYKSLNDLSRSYMNDIFSRNVSLYFARRPLSVPRVKQRTFGLKSMRYEGAKIWNHLPESIKSSQNPHVFKQLNMKTWQGPTWKCNFCSTCFRKLMILLKRKKILEVNMLTYCLGHSNHFL